MQTGAHPHLYGSPRKRGPIMLSARRDGGSRHGVRTVRAPKSKIEARQARNQDRGTSRGIGAAPVAGAAHSWLASQQILVEAPRLHDGCEGAPLVLQQLQIGHRITIHEKQIRYGSGLDDP